MSDESLEVRLALLEASVENLISAIDKRDKKIDALLELKNRGLGALWFAALIFGSVTLGGLSTVLSWIKQ